MDFIDDEADASDDHGSVLVPSSQNDQEFNAARPVKRRRLNPIDNSSSDEAADSGPDDYDLPSHGGNTQNASEEDLLVSKSKYEGVMHVPQYAETQKDTFVTQLTQPWSSPTRIRGPRWRKSNTLPSPEPRLDVRRSVTIASLPLDAPAQHRVEQPMLAKATEQVRQESDDEFNDDHATALEAFMSSPIQNEKGIQNSKQVCPTQFQPLATKNYKQTTLFGAAATQPGVASTQAVRAHAWPLANKNEPPSHHKIDLEAMKSWVYPTNLGKIRDYQFTIVHKALFHNLLVALPTGLGKTFIAATVMLNWFRWTKEAQIIFVAPTKPLVSQQIDACFNIAGIPRSQTTMLTGEVSPAVRAEEWQEKRVFFMTPQTLVNDLKNGMCDPKKIVLVVVDEAHKATGNYAYVEVVRFLRRFNSSFRVLALTATPGGTVEAVQTVIDGLDIARVEIRTEESMDIRDFVHSRNIQLEVFDNSDELNMAVELFAAAVKPVMNKLTSQNAYWGKDPTMITLFGLKKARDEWAKTEVGRSANWGLKGMINSVFNALMSLAHNLELLKYHGIGPFYHKMRIFEDEVASTNKYARQIVEDEHFIKLKNRLRTWCNDNEFVGHPKLAYLKRVVLNHFLDAGDGRGAAGGRAPSDTRIMIFAHYRDSAEEIVRVLKRHGDMVRPHVFVGQSGTKGSEGMDQKTQIDIIQKFKAGKYNTLVATSIGEEGLDIGEVDLIVCYDCSKSPIRMLQRMGRTGRKRAGNIVLLLMRGKEENDYYKAKDNYVKMQEIIESGKNFAFHEENSPRIVPKEIVPVVDKQIVEIPVENTQADVWDLRARRPKNPKRPAKKFNMPDGVETGFTFLGKGRSKRTTVTPETPKLDVCAVSLPLLSDILLSSEEEVELEQRYAQIAGTEPQFIRQVKLEAFPEQLQKLGKTSLVKHSKRTKDLVKAVNRSRRSGKDWTRPSSQGIMKSFNVSETLVSSPCTTMEARNCVGKLVPQSPHTSETLGFSDTPQSPNDYDLKDDFIDDGIVVVDQNNLDEGQSSGCRNVPLSAAHKHSNIDKPFYASQHSLADNSDGELPDLQDLVGRKPFIPLAMAMQRRTGRVRKIIDSDDEW